VVYRADITGGDPWEAAVVAGATSYASAGVGGSGWAWYTKVFWYGVIGGTVSKHYGGEFEQGFKASAAGSAVGFGLNSMKVYPAISASVAGGVSAELGGGKFKNGAAQGAFAYAVSGMFAEAGQNETATQRNRVYAVADGEVFRADYQNPNDPNSGLGYRVSIRDENGYYQYGHMDPDSLNIQVGDTVRRGDFIGEYADPTNGRSSAPHVHIERRLWSNPRVTVDPGNISPLGSTGVRTARWQGIDSMHRTPHQGVDWAYPRRQQ